MRLVLSLTIVASALGPGCDWLLPYPDGEITCDPNNRGARCPDGYACLDVHKDDRTVCVEVGCGDGNVDATSEKCDDANRNPLDMCGTSCRVAAFVPTVAAGFGPGGAQAATASIGQPGGLAADRDGNVYVSAFGSNAVHRYDAHARALTTFAGNGSIVSIGDGRASPPNEIATPIIGGVAVDGAGNVYLADLFENVILRVDGVTGRVDTVVPTRPSNVAIGFATQPTASTARPTAVGVNGDGALFFIDDDIADPALGELGAVVRRIREVDPRTGEMITVHSGTDGQNPLGFGSVSFDDNGTLYSLGDFHLLVQPAGRAATLTDLRPTPECPPTLGLQHKIAVTPDGSSIYYASFAKVIRVDLTRTANTVSVACTEITELPYASDTESLPIVNTFSDPGPLDLTFARATDDTPASVLAADPTNGMVWRIAADTSGTLEPFIGTPPVAGGSDFARDVVIDLALQTDGRLGFSETRECRDLLPADAPRLDRKNLELYAAFPDQHRILTVNCADLITFVAGDGTPGDSDGGGDPLRAQLNNPVAAVRALNGNVYIADRDNDSIRQITEFAPDGTPLAAPVMSTLIGPHDPALAGAQLTRPSGLVADDSGRLIIADSGNGRILRVDPLTLEAEVLKEGLLEPSALVFVPFGFSPDLLQLATACDVPKDTPTVDPCGMLIFAERGGHRVRAIALEPLLDLEFDLAGSPIGADPAPGDHDEITIDGVTRSEMRFPRGITLDLPSSIVDASGATVPSPNFLIIDSVHRLRRMSLDSFQLLPPTIHAAVTTVTPLDLDGVGLPSSDDSIDGSGFLRGPVGTAALDADHVLIVERVTGRLREATVSTGALLSVAGLPAGTEVVGSSVTLAAETVPLEGAEGLAFDAAASVAYVSESTLGRVRRFQIVDPATPATWTTDVLPLATGAVGEPAGLSIDAGSGDLYIADRSAHTVLRVASDGTVATVAGLSAQRGFAGDDGLAVDALLNAPQGVLYAAREGRRLLYIADAGNERVRRVDLDTGIITTVLGDGSSGSGGEGAPARGFPVSSPRGLALDSAGNLFVTSGNAIRMVQADTFFDPTSEAGVADGADAVATIYGKPPRAIFPESVTRCIASVEVATNTEGSATRVLAVDSCLGVLLLLDRNELPQ